MGRHSSRKFELGDTLWLTDANSRSLDTIVAVQGLTKNRHITRALQIHSHIMGAEQGHDRLLVYKDACDEKELTVCRDEVTINEDAVSVPNHLPEDAREFLRDVYKVEGRGLMQTVNNAMTQYAEFMEDHLMAHGSNSILQLAK